MKKIFLFLALVLCISLLAGCIGTPVVYQVNCTCPTATTGNAGGNKPITPPVSGGEGALKTGLYLSAGIGDSTSASAEQDGEAKYDVTMVAVLVDDQGVIQACVIDGVSTSVKFNASGAIVTDLSKAPQTKNELGAAYGMVQYGHAIAEWDAQAAALAAFAVGKTVEELRSGAIDETGYAPDGTDLATSATIYLGGYVSAIEKAVANAQYLGAQAGDVLKLAAINGIDGSAAATADKAGTAQLEVTVTALTMKGDVITSCAIDSIQAKVSFDISGNITTDLSVAPQTKNELGAAYGMVKYGHAIAEWSEQAASFAAYITGKTLDQVMGIAVNEKTAPTEADLSTSVTIAIGGFQALIQKAVR